MSRPDSIFASKRTSDSAGASIALAAGLIVLAVGAAYSNGFSGPFVFDDLASIAHNPTIRHLWPPGPVLTPPTGGMTVAGRPVLNFSFAVNYAISGERPWSYHALNLVIHLCAALTLFGIVRRTLGRCNSLRPTLLALGVALIWALHPLQTESVTYIVQRAESLMGLFYLQTLYCFIRQAEAAGSAKAWRLPLPAGSGTACPPKPGEGGRQRFVAGWAVLSILACLFGMATKEVMVTAPVVVLLYDRTFVAGSFREAWRRRRWLYSLLRPLGFCRFT